MTAAAVTGVRFVLSNFAEPSRWEETAQWYDTYARRLSDPGRLGRSQRLENARAAGTESDPRLLAVYDILDADPSDAWPATEASERYPRDLFAAEPAQFVHAALRGSWTLVGRRGGDFEADAQRAGLLVLLSENGDDTARAAFEQAMIETGVVASSARWRLIEGFPDARGWLETFEIVSGDPASALERTAHVARPDGADYGYAAVFTPIIRSEK